MDDVFPCSSSSSIISLFILWFLRHSTGPGGRRAAKTSCFVGSMVIVRLVSCAARRLLSGLATLGLHRGWGGNWSSPKNCAKLFWASSATTPFESTNITTQDAAGLFRSIDGAKSGLLTMKCADDWIGGTVEWIIQPKRFASQSGSFTSYPMIKRTKRENKKNKKRCLDHVMKVMKVIICFTEL